MDLQKNFWDSILNKFFFLFLFIIFHKEVSNLKMNKFKKKVKSDWDNYSRRYCVVCQKTKVFEFNKTIGHSECTDCGARFPKNPKNINFEDEYEVILFKKDKEMSSLKKLLIEERNKNKELRVQIGNCQKKADENFIEVAEEILNIIEDNEPFFALQAIVKFLNMRLKKKCKKMMD